MSNSIETVIVPTGKINFDHSTGVMWANWSNGYNETWSRRGYSVEQKLESFRSFIDMMKDYEG